jgi:2-hydroxychromene-2-carboxylate isomerase
VEPVFLFDFGSPNAYLAHRLIPGIEARTGVRFRYLPVLLGGLFKLSGNQSPATAYANVPNKAAYEGREMARFIAKHNLAAFRWNPYFPVNTLAPMRAAVSAEALGVLESYVETMFRFMWEDPRKLDEPEVLRTTLLEAGLPADQLLDRAQEQEVKDRLLANTRYAFEQGAFGVPSFLLGDQLYFGKDRLGDVEDELVLETACGRVACPPPS